MILNDKTRALFSDIPDKLAAVTHLALMIPQPELRDINPAEFGWGAQCLD
jgi:hypothetical protein